VRHPWSELTGHFLALPNPQYQYQQDNQAARNLACTSIIHGRQIISVLLVILAVILLVIMFVRQHTKRTAKITFTARM